MEIGSEWIADFLTQLRLQNPALRIDLHSKRDFAQLRELMWRDAIDIALTLPLDVPHFVVHYIWRDPYQLLVPRVLVPQLDGVANLLDISYFAYRHEGVVALHAQLEALGIPHRQSVQFDNLEVIIALIRRGLGYSVLPASAIPDNLGGVHALALPSHVSRPIAALAAPYSLMAKAVRSALDVLRDISPASRIG